MDTTKTNESNASANGSLQESFRNSCSKAERCVRADPRKSMLVSLGAGLGIGIALGLVLGGSRQSSSNPWFDRRAAEQLGQQALANMSKWLPDAISDRIQ